MQSIRTRLESSLLLLLMSLSILDVSDGTSDPTVATLLPTSKQLPLDSTTAPITLVPSQGLPYDAATLMSDSSTEPITFVPNQGLLYDAASLMSDLRLFRT